LLLLQNVGFAKHFLEAGLIVRIAFQIADTGITNAETQRLLQNFVLHRSTA